MSEPSSPPPFTAETASNYNKAATGVKGAAWASVANQALESRRFTRAEAIREANAALRDGRTTFRPRFGT